MRFRRNFLLAVVTTLSLFIVSLANAVSLTRNVQNVFSSGLGVSPTAIVGSSSIQNLTVGDFIHLSVDVENSGGELIVSIYTTLIIDPTIVSLSSGSFQSAIFFVPISGRPFFDPPQSLFSHLAGSVIKVASLPLGDQVQAMAFHSTVGSNGTGPDLNASTIVLEAVGKGSIDLTLGFFFSNDLISFYGIPFAGTAAAALVLVNNSTIAVSTTGSSINDADGDLVLDLFDNCRFVANGPGEISNQVNTNFGSDHPSAGELGDVCDADFNDDGFFDGPDFSSFLSQFHSTNQVYDLNGDGFVEGPDFGILLSFFNSVPGPGATAN